MRKCEAFHDYATEVVSNGNIRMDNIVLAATNDSRLQEHIRTQVELAFYEGWHAADTPANKKGGAE